MSSRTWLASFLLLGAGAALSGYQQTRATGQRRSRQYEYEMQSPASEDPPDAWVEGEFTFARLRYRGYSGGGGGRFGGRRRGGGSSWGTDSNTAERHLMQGVRRLSRINARSVEEIIDPDSDELFNWPWLYAVEVGHWELTDSQAQRVRKYLDRGGFLMVDDFHGEQEWAVFMESLRRVFPDQLPMEIPDSDPIFHVIFDLEKRIQVPGYQYVRSGRTYERIDGTQAHWRGIFDDKGRVQVAICHNVDLGDAWEWSDAPEYPEPFAGMAYRIGLNYITYAMTH